MSSASACKFMKIIQRFRKWFSFGLHTQKRLPLTHRQEAGVCNCSLILFPDKNAPRCAANFAFWLTRIEHLVAAQFFCRSRRSAALCPQILPRRIKKTARSAQTVFLLFAVSSLSVMALRHLNPHIHQHIRQKLAARRARLRPISAQYTGMFCSCHVWLTAVRIA